MYVRVMIKWRL